MKLTKIIEKLRETVLHPQKPYWILITLALMALALLMAQENTQPMAPEFKLNPTSVDTYIPAGHVLVTLQLTNTESIDSIIGQFGLVDLYEASENFAPGAKKVAQPIARRLKIIRAPNNPSLFGVLIADNETEIIQKLAGPVFAVIQGPTEAGPARSLEGKQKFKRPIQFGDVL